MRVRLDLPDAGLCGDTRREGEPRLARVGIRSRGLVAQALVGQGVTVFLNQNVSHLVSDNERSVVEPEPTLLKAIIDPQTWHLLGCVVVGDHAATIANSAAIAIESGLSVKDLREIPLTQPSDGSSNSHVAEAGLVLAYSARFYTMVGVQSFSAISRLFEAHEMKFLCDNRGDLSTDLGTSGVVLLSINLRSLLSAAEAAFGWLNVNVFVTTALQTPLCTSICEFFGLAQFNHQNPH